MRPNLPAALASIFLVACAAPCQAQRGIPVPRVSPGPVRVAPIFPHGGSSRGSGEFIEPIPLILGLAALVGGVMTLVCFAHGWRSKPVACVRIVQVPPGEAPEEIRRAWVGLELPLLRGAAEPLPAVSVGVLSHQNSAVVPGYAVDGRLAMEALAGRSPEAAAWWQQNAPHVVEPGYRLLFPAEVCEMPPPAGFYGVANTVEPASQPLGARRWPPATFGWALLTIAALVGLVVWS